MHTANGLELMGSFRHAALLFVHTLVRSQPLTDFDSMKPILNVFIVRGTHLYYERQRSSYNRVECHTTGN